MSKREKCPICGKPFKNVNYHQKISHPETLSSEVKNETAATEVLPVQETPKEDMQPVSVTETADAAKETPVAEKPVIEKEQNTRNYFKIITAVPIFIIGAFILYAGRMNPLAILFGAVIMVGAFFLARWGWNQGSIRIIGAAAEKNGTPLIPPNSLVLHCSDKLHRTNWFAYEYVAHPLGQRKKRRNDNTWWYVMREISEKDRTLVEHTLPDNSESEVYCNPEIMGNAFSLPATKRLFDFNPDNLKTISLVVMGVIIAGELVALIALTGNTAEETAAVISIFANLI